MKRPAVPCPACGRPVGMIRTRGLVVYSCLDCPGVAGRMGKNLAAVELGRLGGAAGKGVRSEARTAACRKAATVRWGRYRARVEAEKLAGD